MLENKKVAFQGALGAYSHVVAKRMYTKATMLPCTTFEEVFEKVKSKKADVGVIPIDNSVAGRVADIHYLLPRFKTHIIGEHFEPISHSLWGVKGSSLKTITSVASHIHALNQCRKFIKKRRLDSVVHADTAGSARDLSISGDIHQSAIASELAGKLYGLKLLARNIEDTDHNTTRFIFISNKAEIPRESERTIISFIFRVRSVPAALFKAIGGFATNGVNIIKLESYFVDEKFTVAQFYVEMEGHPKEKRVRLAFEELSFFSEEVTILGVYSADPFRFTQHATGK